MSARASKILRRLLTLMAVAIGVIGSISYFSSSSINYRSDTSERDGFVVLAGCTSGGGILGFYYERLPRILAGVPANAIGQKIPGTVASYVGRRWMAWFRWRSPVRNSWWFRFTSTTVQVWPSKAAASAITSAPAITLPVRQTSAWIPYWFFLVIAAPYLLYTLMDLPNQRRRNRFAAGRCIACGYDLRHSPDRCPECGVARTTAPPPARRLAGFDLLGILGRNLWLRICLYIVFFALFCFGFSAAYLWYYQK